MADNNKRINDRVSSKNLISYICKDDNNNDVETGMGRTLNVSESGIMLETHNLIDKNMSILLSIGLEDKLVDIKGKIIHSTEVDEGRYHTGIQFIGMDDKTSQMLAKYIKSFMPSS